MSMDFGLTLGRFWRATDGFDDQSGFEGCQPGSYLGP